MTSFPSAKSWPLVFLALCAGAVGSGATPLIDGGRATRWKYLDDGSDPGSAWSGIGFPDGGWRTGPAPLGYGRPDVATEVRFGGDPRAKHLTTYFRREFNVDDPAALGQLALVYRIDDGAIFYLNGQEFLRENMPPELPMPSTSALRRIEGGEERISRRQVVPATLLVAGRNVIAVEVHQFNRASSDLFLDLLLAPHLEGKEPVLKSYRGEKEALPIRLAATARDMTLTYRYSHYIGAGTHLPEGFLDGGPKMIIEADGEVHADQEVVVVDRARDAVLRQQLDYARSPAIARLRPLERASALARYVDEQLSPAGGRGQADAACSVLIAPYRGFELLLGQMQRAGMCRHRALLFKVLADEAELPVTLVRGFLGTPEDAQGHAWNELIMPNGEKLIVDAMNPRPGFKLPKVTDRAAERYLTEDRQPYYPTKKTVQR